MRQETNKEIDLLLRRMSRQNGGSVSEVTEQHLDADEMSSYAQNALPAAARARYMEHLAECSTCRKLVTQLSLSLGATTAAAAPVETVVEPSALKKFLASLFSPLVMRYAVPALGLIVVAAIGFVILRQPREGGFVAQLDTKQNQAAPDTATREAPASSPNTVSDADSQKAQAGQVAAPVTHPKEIAPKSDSVADGVSGSGPAPAPAPTPAATETTASAPQPAAAAEPPPSPKTEVWAYRSKTEEKKKSEDEKKTDTVAKKESDQPTIDTTDTSISTAKANEPARDENRAAKPEDKRVDESKREALPAQGRAATMGGVSNVRRERAQEQKDDAETRTVAGRRFRKERGIWTDTAYDSSTRTVAMARGSEQFRALVADEPEIKKIAEQLDGEVIVVWKGRAYRIR
ncbi:MAG TPA: hypothetical protein VJS13_03125 [Pyrinomonadaceae bacterium]|nr:hypothetical protein [Pyrinomonadaceae bacterium]